MMIVVAGVVCMVVIVFALRPTRGTRYEWDRREWMFKERRK